MHIYLDVRQVHEVLGDVDDQLLHEGGGDVETVLGVVEGEPAYILGDAINQLMPDHNHTYIYTKL